MMKTCVVAGGAGFIGSHLCDALIAKGHRVICIDNLSTGRKANIRHLMKDRRFSFKRQDVSKGISAVGKVDCIFDLASPASPVDFEKMPIKIMMANAYGVKNALELARKKKARLLFASTSEVYGEPLNHPQREEDWGNVNPVGIRSCYDESKRFAEALCMAYHKEYRVDVRIARIFNTYGPRMRTDDGRVIPNFAMQCLRKRALTIYGTGRQTRSFCYVSDMVDGLMRFMFKRGLSGQVINIGNPNEMSILRLAQLMQKIAGCDRGLSFKPLPKDDPTRRKPAIAKAKRLLGWKPAVPIQKGLKETISYFSAQK